MLKNFLKDYFSYSRRERNSIIILLVIIIILLTADFIIPLIISRQEYDYSEFEKKIIEFEQSLEALEKQEYNLPETNIKRQRNVNHSIFRFNPNTATAEDLDNLGFSERVIKNITKYRKKGGVFYRRTDLLKIYGIDTSLYNRLASYIYLNELNTEELKPVRNKAYVHEKNNFGKININTADTGLLKKELGIDSLLSKRIIRYRDLLGGYYNRIQFREIYGIEDKEYNLLVRKVFIDTSLIKKIRINKTDEITLGKHPYLSIYYSKAIMKYKNFTGKISRIDELKHNNILNDDVFVKIKPYLSAD